MSPENTHTLMGFYVESLILGVNTMYMFFCFFKKFLIGCIGLKAHAHAQERAGHVRVGEV